MAHTKSQGSVRGNRDSISKRLGVKVFAGQKINAGGIIVRQRGTKAYAGRNTSRVIVTHYIHYKKEQKDTTTSLRHYHGHKKGPPFNFH